MPLSQQSRYNLLQPSIVDRDKKFILSVNKSFVGRRSHSDLAIDLCPQ